MLYPEGLASPLIPHAASSEVPRREPLDEVDLRILFPTDARHFYAAEHTSATARLATIWHDSSLPGCRAKVARAQTAAWRAERRAWDRSAGHRRRLLLAREWAAADAAHELARHESEVMDQMAAYELEDDAAVAIQRQWRLRQQNRQDLKALEAATTLHLATRGVYASPGLGPDAQKHPMVTESVPFGERPELPRPSAAAAQAAPPRKEASSTALIRPPLHEPVPASGPLSVMGAQSSIAPTESKSLADIFHAASAITASLERLIR